MSQKYAFDVNLVLVVNNEFKGAVITDVTDVHYNLSATLSHIEATYAIVYTP